MDLRTIETIQNDIDHYYDYGEPEGDAALLAFNSGYESLILELEEAKEMRAGVR